MGNKNKNSYAELIEELADMALRKLERTKVTSAAEVHFGTEATSDKNSSLAGTGQQEMLYENMKIKARPASASRSRFIPVHIRRYV